MGNIHNGNKQKHQLSTLDFCIILGAQAMLVITLFSCLSLLMEKVNSLSLSLSIGLNLCIFHFQINCIAWHRCSNRQFMSLHISTVYKNMNVINFFFPRTLKQATPNSNPFNTVMNFTLESSRPGDSAAQRECGYLGTFFHPIPCH